MTPLSDALTAAQRSALAALEKAYVAGSVDAETAVARLNAAGVSDGVDLAFLLSALDVLREWGVSAPTMTERITEAKVEPASDKQLAFIRQLAEEKNLPLPTNYGPMTKAEASRIITDLQTGNYDPAKYDVPF